MPKLVEFRATTLALPRLAKLLLFSHRRYIFVRRGVNCSEVSAGLLGVRLSSDASYCNPFAVVRFTEVEVGFSCDI